MKDRTRLLIVDEQVWIPYTYAEEAMIVDIVEKLPEEQVAEPVTFAGISNGKRNTEVQASLYDAMLAEIMDNRNAEKAKVRNRRRADRKHNVLPKVRKQMRYDRGWNRYLSMPCYGCKNIGIAEYRMDNAEKIARKDYMVELRNIAEDAEREAIEAEYAEWERRYRHEKYMRNLNEWLKYA